MENFWGKKDHRDRLRSLRSSRGLRSFTRNSPGNDSLNQRDSYAEREREMWIKPAKNEQHPISPSNSKSVDMRTLTNLSETEKSRDPFPEPDEVENENKNSSPSSLDLANEHSEPPGVLPEIITRSELPLLDSLEALDSLLQTLNPSNRDITILEQAKKLLNHSIMIVNKDLANIPARQTEQIVAHELSPEIKTVIKTTILETLATLRETYEPPQRQPIPNENITVNESKTYASILKKDQSLNNALILIPKDKKVTGSGLRTTVQSLPLQNVDAVSAIRVRRSHIEIECRDSVKKKQLREQLEKSEELSKEARVEDKRPESTKIVILNVPAFYHKEHVEQSITSELGTEAKFQTTGKPQKSNKQKSNWIIQLSQCNAKKILGKRFLYIGLQACAVKRNITMLRCFNCQAFGHHTAICRNSTLCSNCGEKHSAENCKATPQCLNCVQHNIAKGTEFPVNHPASSSDCRAFTTELKHRREQSDAARRGERCEGHAHLVGRPGQRSSRSGGTNQSVS